MSMMDAPAMVGIEVIAASTPDAVTRRAGRRR